MLHKTATIPENQEFKTLLATAKEKMLRPEQEKQLLNNIRKGDKEAVVKLVESTEWVVLSVIQSLNLEKPTLKEMFNAGKAALMKLAEQEVNSNVRERYFRFGAWVVKQSILVLKSKSS